MAVADSVVLAAGLVVVEARAGIFNRGGGLFMLRMINKPEDIFAEITADFQNALGMDMVSLILYGSAAAGHYVPGKSDVNFLIILTEAGLDDLERVIDVVGKWRKKRVASVFMTQAYIISSVDAYPVEFLNMKLNHRLLFGTDVLTELTFLSRDLRLQLERELKGKMFHLRQGWLECEGKEKGLRQLIKLSLGDFVPLFKALLFLRGYEIPSGRRDVIKSLSLAYPINPDVFLRCIDLREGRGRFSAGEVKQLFKSYQEEIAKVSALIDRTEV